MKILLVNTNTEKFPYPVPPVGLSILAAILRKEHEVRIYDGMFDEGKSLPQELARFKPDITGISIRNIDDMVMGKTQYYVDEVYARFIRPARMHSDAPLILGGSGFSIFPHELIKRYNADFGIIGEGEHTLPRLVQALRTGGDIQSIPGVVTRQESRMQPVPCRNDFNMTSLPFSGMDTRIDFTPYLSRGVYSIQTKRGCSHSCIYCTYPLIEGRGYRFRRAGDIAEEIVQASQRLGSPVFEFVDSTFNDPPGWAEEVCHEIIKRNIRVRIRAMGINPAHTGKELFDLMKRAGFTQIDCTPDSASPGMISRLGKNFTLQQLEATARFISEAELPTMWFFIFGGPGESEKTVEETFRFIDRWISPEDMVYITTGLRIYPGTPLHRIAIGENQVPHGDPLLKPRFYLSGSPGKERLRDMVEQACRSRPNCITAEESTPPERMLAEAIRIRSEQHLSEPMFRTLMRLRQEQARGTNTG